MTADRRARTFGRSFLRCLALIATAGWACSAQAQNGLAYFKNYFVTGDYVTASVGLQHTGINGLATGTLTVDPAAIPAGADIVAAYLYWQTISSSGTPDPNALAGARFKGNDISGNAVLLNGAGTAPCWSSGGSTGSSGGSKATWSYRADVLRYFTRVRPSDPTQPVVVQVAGSHTIVLPDMGTSNQLPSALGAGLVIVYRVGGYDPASGYARARSPLKSVVLYDGAYTMDNQTRQLQLRLEGFYEASRTAPNARMTHLVADGQTNKSEAVYLSSTASASDAVLVATNPFISSNGFGAVDFNGLPLEPGAMKATVSVTPGANGSFDCLSWSAVVMSTVVQDRDLDGLLDVWESRSEWSSKPARLAGVYPVWPLTDPNGVPLPDLQAMGANADVQDVFVQVDYMTGADGHSHLPAKSALQSVATAFHNAPGRPSASAATCPSGSGNCPVAIHFDVGANYQPAATFNLAACTTQWTSDCAIVPAAVAMGGNPIGEVACLPGGVTPTGARCAFPGYAGVVGWKNGLRAYRDAAIKRNTGSTAAPRMPRNRKDIFHYALFAHALGYASPANPRVPRRTSGIADGAGGDLMVTLGLWDNQTGTPFVQASTLMHELGHNFGLRHGGVLPQGVIEPNCKSNYQSVMNYLFQVRGLLTPKGVPAIDYSRQQLPALSERALSEPVGLGATTPYLARWYAPAGASFVDRALNTTPATRRCDGSPVAATDVPYVRVDGDPRASGIDWNGDGTITGVDSLDANFDGIPGESFTGSNDWWTMDLRQVGARRPVGSKSVSYSVIDPATGVAPVAPAPAVGGGLSLDSGYGDLGYGDLGYGDLGYGDLGYGDLGYGDLGYGDLGYGDLGYGDLGVPADEPLGSGDLNLDTAGSLGNAPSSLAATSLKGNAGIQVAWAAPSVGAPLSYQLYRVIGASVTPANFALRVLVGNVPGSVTSLIDASGTLKNNVAYTYFVTATLPPPVGCVPSANYDCVANQQSGISNYATVVY